MTNITAKRKLDNRPAGTNSYADLPDYVIEWCDKYLRNTAWFAGREGNSLYTFPGAKSGNRIYAYRMMERVGNALKDMRLEEGNALFITLTAAYTKTQKGIDSSWDRFRKELPKFKRKIKNLGFKSFMSVLEAHADGGCHAHLVIKQHGKPFPYFLDRKGKARLDDERLREKLQAAWGGHVDIQVITSSGAGDYIQKEIGKASHIEEALKRAKAGEAKKSDVKKLWAHYQATRRKIRRWGVSRDLIKHMTNTTEPEELEPPEYVMLTKEQVAADWFEPITGAVDPASEAYRHLKAILDRRKAIGDSVREALGLKQNLL